MKVPDVTSDDGRMRKLFARTNVAQKCINHETALSILQSAATDIKTFQPDEGDELLNRFIKMHQFLVIKILFYLSLLVDRSVSSSFSCALQGK